MTAYWLFRLGCRWLILAVAWAGASFLHSAAAEVPTEWRTVVEQCFRQTANGARDGEAYWQTLQAEVLGELEKADPASLTKERLHCIRADLPELLKQVAEYVAQLGGSALRDSDKGLMQALLRWRISRFLKQPIPSQGQRERTLAQLTGLFEETREWLSSELPGVAAELGNLWPAVRERIARKLNSPLLLGRPIPLAEATVEQVRAYLKAVCHQMATRASGRPEDAKVRELWDRSNARHLLGVLEVLAFMPDASELPEGMREELARIARQQMTAASTQLVQSWAQQQQTTLRGLLGHSANGAIVTSMLTNALLAGIGAFWGRPLPECEENWP